MQSSKRREKLSPEYNCRRCFLPEKDLAIGCPDCELTEVETLFYKNVIRRSSELYGTGEFEWVFTDATLPEVLDLHAAVSEMLMTNKNRISPEWDEATAELAQIVLSEQRLERAAQMWELTVNKSGGNNA